MSESPGGSSGGEGASGPPPEGTPRRLDPDAAAAARRPARHPPPPVVDTRRYQRVIGVFGLLLVIIISVSFLTTRGPGTAGVPAGKTLPVFAAPLAASNLNRAANLHPHCTLAQHDLRALNVCLLVQRAPLVLAFFVTSSGGCEGAVDALQTLSRQFSPAEVQFAAVAVHVSHADAARAVRTHHWTIPVGYDTDGRVGAAYGIEVCPIIELTRRGGRVARRLIGEHWDSSSELAAQVRMLVGR